MKSLIILGAGGHGRVALETAILMDEYSEISFLDDNRKESILGHKVLGKLNYAIENLELSKNHKFFVGIGNCEIRHYWLTKLVKHKYDLATLIHPKSYISCEANLGCGSIILANSTVQTNVRSGIGLIVNNNASIDHDCLIGDSVHICPGVNMAGNIKIGDNSWIGIGSTIIQNINIGNNAFVGASSCVINDIDDNQKVFGIPAKNSK